MPHTPTAATPLAAAALLLLLAARGGQGQVGPETTIRFERPAGPLSSYIVNGMVQDRRGFIWLASDRGLVRHDGYESVVYRFDPDDASSLPTKSVLSVAEAGDGRLWVGTANRLYRFDPATEEFELFPPDIWRGIEGASIASIVEDRGGRVWLGMLHWGGPVDCTACGGVLRIDPATGEWKRFLHDPRDPGSLSHNRVRVVFEDERGTIWVGTWDGLDRYDETTGEFAHYRHDPTDPSSLSYNDVKDILEDREGRLWVGTIGGGLNLLDREGGKFTHFRHDPGDPGSLSSDFTIDLEEDHAGRIWIATLDAGLNRFDPGSGAFRRFLPDATDPQSLSHEQLLALYQTRDGVLWISSRDPDVPRGAVDRVSLSEPPFTLFPRDSLAGFGLGADVVTALHQDEDGTLWVGTAVAGLQRIDRRSGAVERYRHDPHDPSSLGANYVLAITRDDRGSLWVSTRGGGLDRLEPATRSFTRHPFDPRVSSCEVQLDIGDLLGDGEALWLAVSRHGLCRFQPATGRATRYAPADPEGAAWLKGIADARERKGHLRSSSSGGVQISMSDERLYRDRDGAIWIATSGLGVFRFDPATGAFTRYAHDPANPASLSDDLVNGVYEDARGVLWIATYDGGLNRFDPETDSFTRFTQQNSGLPSNEITAVLGGQPLELWVASGSRLARLNTDTREAQIYDMSRWGVVFLPNAALEGRDGELFFGGYGGLVSFHPGEIADDPQPPQLALTGFQVFGESGAAEGGPGSDPLRKLRLTGGVTLAHDQNDISLTYVGLHFVAPEAIRYAYQLQGYDSDWRDAGDGRTATYTNVPAGEYVFRVRAANRDGVWSAPTPLAGITITPPWWATWWAYLLYAILAGAILYAARRYELNRVSLRNRLEFERVEAQNLRELDELKSRFFANISHEFRTPLTLVLGQIESMLSANVTEEFGRRLAMARRNARRLLRLVTELLDLAKLEAGRMELKAARGNVIPLLKSIVFSFESHARDRQIRLGFETTDDVIEVRHDREVLERVLVNLLANAFKFTERGGSVTVRVAVENREDKPGQARGPGSGGCVSITVEDTGQGIAEEHLPHVFDRFYQVESWEHHQQGTGIGLSLTRELVDLHGGTISVQSRLGVGTRFVVRLPLETTAAGAVDPELAAADAAVRAIAAERPEAETAVRAIDSERPEAEAAEAAASVADAERAPAEPTSISRRALDVVESLIDRSAGTRSASSESNPDSDIVLIVEDNPDVRSYICDQLRDGYQIVEAADGEDGLSRAQEIIPDLIITDLMMPKLDGGRLTRILRADERTSHIPIIILTARASESSKIEGIETGADDYLIKPFSAAELRARVKNLIELRRLLRQRFSAATVIRPSEVTATDVDRAFLERVIAAIESFMGDDDLNVGRLAAEVHLSDSQLNRKLKALVDQTAGQLIRSMRLQRAADLLAQNAGTVTQIALQVGFKNHAHFSTSFKEQFGCAPSDYRSQKARVGP